ncbi:succinate dehydrogenase subunit 6, mitochondrial-like [Aristolochia californica]|uniref:succinate dehydrogenase subunit 6, mitochondrial-like n=1 Tax=Aristolochia californica TaxID=171875 RepID=UPI0035DF952F
MGESDGSPSDGYWENWKAYWRQRFAFLEYHKRIFLIPEKQLPKWSSSDVEEFIASDHIHGPVLKTAREAATIAAYGSGIGAVSTAGLAWKYSKSPHGAVMAFGAGAIFGWTFGQEIASHWLQLYRLDTMSAQMKFLDWWKQKSEA